MAIPFGEAANFYLSMKQPTAEQEKTAGLTDEPDETGELEGAFDVPKETAVALMQTVITKAMTLMQASLIYSMSLKGCCEAQTVKRALDCRDWEYKNLIEYLTRRASVLAGAVHVGDTEPVPPSTDPTTIARSMIRGEQELMQSLRALKEAVGENPMEAKLCQFLASSQERADDLWRALDPESKPALPPQLQGMMDQAGPEVAQEAEEPDEGATQVVAAEPEGDEGATPVVAAEEGEEEAPEAELDEKTSSVKLALREEYESFGRRKARHDKAQQEGFAKAVKFLRSRGKEKSSALGCARKTAAPLDFSKLEKFDPKKHKVIAGNPTAAPTRTSMAVDEAIRRFNAQSAQARNAAFRRPMSRVQAAKRQRADAQEASMAKDLAAGLSPEEIRQRHPVKLGAASKEELVDRLRKAKMTGTERGIAQARKNIVTDRERRGQRYGKSIGAIAGGLGGAAAGKKLIGGKGPAGAIAGLAAGVLAGREAGGTVGRSADIKRHLRKPPKEKKASIEDRFRAALLKLGQEPGQPMEPEAPMAPGSGGEGPGMPQQQVGLPGPDAAGGPPPPPAPAAAPTQPTNFLEAELMGQQAQGAQEAQYYKGIAEDAQGQASEMQQAIDGMQQQLQELQMQADQAGQSIQQSSQQAMQAQDEALKQTQVAANMRMGMQKLRAQMLEVASQDPAEVAAQELQAGAQGGMPPGAPEGEDPTAMGPDAAGGGGMPASPAKAEKEVEEADRAQNEADMQAQQAEQAAPPPPPEGAPPPGAAPGPPGGADMSTMAPTAGLKVGSVKTAGLADEAMHQAKQRLPWALAGAGLGAAYGHSQSLSAPGLRERARSLEASEQGGFRQAMRLAVAKHRAADAEAAAANPPHAMALHALRGAAAGAVAGPTIQSGVRNIRRNLKVL
jgi:hypothetical protein